MVFLKLEWYSWNQTFYSRNQSVSGIQRTRMVFKAIKWVSYSAMKYLIGFLARATLFCVNSWKFLQKHHVLNLPVPPTVKWNSRRIFSFVFDGIISKILDTRRTALVCDWRQKKSKSDIRKMKMKSKFPWDSYFYIRIYWPQQQIFEYSPVLPCILLSLLTGNCDLSISTISPRGPWPSVSAKAKLKGWTLWKYERNSYKWRLKS